MPLHRTTERHQSWSQSLGRGRSAEGIDAKFFIFGDIEKLERFVELPRPKRIPLGAHDYCARSAYAIRGYRRRGRTGKSDCLLAHPVRRARATTLTAQS